MTLAAPLNRSILSATCFLMLCIHSHRAVSPAFTIQNIPIPWIVSFRLSWLPTPNAQRTASGVRASIGSNVPIAGDIALDGKSATQRRFEDNKSPPSLRYIWYSLIRTDLNRNRIRRSPPLLLPLTSVRLRSQLDSAVVFEGGYKIESVTDEKQEPMLHRQDHDENRS